MVVFFDIDGTLIDDRTMQIPESAVRAVRKLQENGHIAVINTGRPYTHVDPRVLDMGFRGAVCGCGMEVLLDGQWISRTYPSREVQQYAVEAGRKYRMNPAYEAQNATILLDGQASAQKILWNDKDQLGAKGFNFRLLEETPDWEFIKFIAFAEEGSDLPGYTAALEQYFTVIDRGNSMVELVLKGCSKAHGMQMVMDKLGVTADQTLAVGDSTNDLPMFALAGHTVCMGGGMAQVKEISEYITDTVMNDGVEKALQHFGLI